MQSGHIAYNVKFMGSAPVSQSSGQEVFDEAMQKIKFQQNLRKVDRELAKNPKVELTVSIDGITIESAKKSKKSNKTGLSTKSPVCTGGSETNSISSNASSNYTPNANEKNVAFNFNERKQFPIHRISFSDVCSNNSKIFCFISKQVGSEQSSNFLCYTFTARKAAMAEEIVLTIGQAFDLAYRRYLSSSTAEREMRTKLLIMEKRLALLERENEFMRNKLLQVGVKEEDIPRERFSADTVTLSDSKSSDMKTSTHDITPSPDLLLLDMSTPSPKRKDLNNSNGLHQHSNDANRNLSEFELFSSPASQTAYTAPPTMAPPSLPANNTNFEDNFNPIDVQPPVPPRRVVALQDMLRVDSTKDDDDDDPFGHGDFSKMV